MTAKEYLMQYKKLSTKIKLLEEDIISLTATIGSVPVPKDKDMPRMRNTSNTTEDKLVKLIDLKKDREEAVIKARLKAVEISETIMSLADTDDPDASTYMKLLYDRYILLMPWNEVAEAISYNENYARGDLHGRALKAVTPLIPNTI